MDLTTAITLWEDRVGDSGEAPTDDELHTFALAVESAVREQIARDIEADAEGYDPEAPDYFRGCRHGEMTAARIARGES